MYIIVLCYIQFMYGFFFVKNGVLNVYVVYIYVYDDELILYIYIY